MRHHQTRKHRSKYQTAVACFKSGPVEGEILAKQIGPTTVHIVATFSKLPKGKHGFHIHKAGDLRGEGCKGACAHFHKGSPQPHGGYKTRRRHTGDLGNIELSAKGHLKKTYTLKGLRIPELWGRSIIVHADEDDLGEGGHEDSHITGHSGSRIGCAIFGRGMECTI
jgi:Cu-Zn family superoxide dismutase